MRRQRKMDDVAKTKKEDGKNRDTYVAENDAKIGYIAAAVSITAPENLDLRDMSEDYGDESGRSEDPDHTAGKGSKRKGMRLSNMVVVKFGVFRNHRAKRLVAISTD